MIGILILLIVVVLLLILKSKKSESETGPFRAKKFLLSRTELSFYKVLNECLPRTKVVMCKVGLKEIIESASSDRGQRWKDWGRIKSKHLDFVVMDAGSSGIVCCIELDDSSHNSPTAQKRDRVKDDALKSAGVRLHRVRVSASYSREQIIGMVGNS